VFYDDPGVDNSLDDDDELLPTAKEGLSELDEDELPELNDLPEDPDSDEDEFVEGSPRFEQFRNDFTKAFGLPLEEARDLVQGLKQESVKRAINEQKYELSAAWDVPVTEVDQRLMIVKKMWDKLPADKQQAYDSTKGAQVLYARYMQNSERKATTRTATGTKAGLAGGKATASKYMYTQSQIDAMDAPTYAANATNIALAYAQGKVRSNRTSR
jgi:hypothetical protein